MGIISGILGAIVGIASLASYPALILAGLPPITANVTNLTSQVLLSIGSFVSSFKDIKGHYKETFLYFILLMIGAIIGTVIVLMESGSSFAKIVPFFVLAATGLIMKPKSKHPAHIEKRPWVKWISAIVIFLLGIYCTYFGAGSGIVFLALMAVTSSHSFRVYNSIRNVSVSSACVVAAVVYTLKANVDWPIVLPLGIGMMVGGYLGPIIVRHVNPKHIKAFVVVCALVLTVYLFAKAY